MAGGEDAEGVGFLVLYVTKKTSADEVWWFLSPVPEHILELFEVADYSMQKLQLKYLGVLIFLTSGISPSL